MNKAQELCCFKCSAYSHKNCLNISTVITNSVKKSGYAFVCRPYKKFAQKNEHWVTLPIFDQHHSSDSNDVKPASSKLVAKALKMTRFFSLSMLSSIMRGLDQSQL